MKTPQMEVADNLLRELSDRGQMIEGGWKAFELLSLKNTSPVQRAEMRKAWFFGAQHCFASIFHMMGPEDEPTDLDCERLSKLDAELKKFLGEMASHP